MRDGIYLELVNKVRDTALSLEPIREKHRIEFEKYESAIRKATELILRADDNALALHLEELEKLKSEAEIEDV